MVRKSVWATRYNEFYKFLEQKPTNKEILWKIHHLIDACKGYHYANISYSAEREIEKLIGKEESGKRKR